MKKLFIVMVFALIATSRAWAQEDLPKFEAVGGFALQRSGGENLTGWSGSATGYVNEIFGIEGEVAGFYKNLYGIDVSSYSFMAGPHFSGRYSWATIFGHALFGTMHTKANYEGMSGTSNNFSMSFGVGVDVNVTSRIAVRAGQFDVIYGIVNSTLAKDFRYTGGVVIKFGTR